MEQKRGWGKAMGLALAVSALACGPAYEDPSGSGSPEELANGEEALQSDVELSNESLALAPSSDVERANVVGAPDNRKLYRDIDDGTSFSQADDNQSFVQLQGARSGVHTVGYTSDRTGTVVRVEVRYRGKGTGAGGRVLVELLDGSRRIALGRANQLRNGWQDYTDVFTGLSVASASTLRTRLRLEAEKGRGGPQYTQIWIRVTLQKPVKPARRVDVFLIRELDTCVIGNRCATSDCIPLSDASGTPRVLFANDGSFRAVPPGDPAVGAAEVSQCLRLRMDDAESAARITELNQFRENVASWTNGDLRVELKIHELSRVEMGESGYGLGLWIGPWDIQEIATPYLTRDTDFILVTPPIQDPDTGLHHELPACGLTYGADYGVAGAGYSWIPKSQGAFWFECAAQSVYMHEWLHQVEFAVQNLSNFNDLYHGSYPPCSQGDPNPRRWFPSTHDCLVDPDFINCGKSDCGGADLVNEHDLRTHWDPARRFVANHCKDGVQDFGESAVDFGGNCLGPGSSPAPKLSAPVPVATPLPEPVCGGP